MNDVAKITKKRIKKAERLLDSLRIAQTKSISDDERKKLEKDEYVLSIFLTCAYQQEARG
jgi:hypothetical protein